MQVHRTVIDGVLQFVPTPDDGAVTAFDAVARRHGIDPTAFVRDSRARSARGAVRGLHGTGAAMFVRCAHGAMYDVVVDARPDSPTFGRVAVFLLDDTDMRRLLVPAGCLHGFQALTDVVDTRYRIDTPPDPAHDVAVAHDDPDLAVRWPVPVGTVSAGDRAAGSWRDLCSRLGVTSPERPRAVVW